MECVWSQSFALGRRPWGDVRAGLQGPLQEMGGSVSVGPALALALAPALPRMARLGSGGLEGSLQLTATQADGPDEEAAQTEGGGHAHAARHGHHYPVVEAHAGLAAEFRAGVGGQRR